MEIDDPNYEPTKELFQFLCDDTAPAAAFRHLIDTYIAVGQAVINQGMEKDITQHLNDPAPHNINDIRLDLVHSLAQIASIPMPDTATVN